MTQILITLPTGQLIDELKNRCQDMREFKNHQPGFVNLAWLINIMDQEANEGHKHD